MSAVNRVATGCKIRTQTPSWPLSPNQGYYMPAGKLNPIRFYSDPLYKIRCKIVRQVFALGTFEHIFPNPTTSIQNLFNGVPINHN